MKAIFDKLDVGKKFIFTFFQITVAVLINVIILQILLGSADIEINNFSTKTYVSVKSQISIRNDLISINQALLNMITSANSANDSNVKQIETSEKDIEIEVKNITSISSDSSMMSEFSVNFQKTEKTVDQIKQLMLAGNKNDAFSIYIDDFIPAFSLMNNAIKKIENDTDSQVAEEFSLYKTDKQRALLLFALIAGIALIFTGYILNVFRSSLVVPLRKIYGACTDLCNGKKIEELEINAKDEFGEMAHSFVAMSHNIEFVIVDMCNMLSQGASKDLNVSTEDKSKYIGIYRELVVSTYAIFADISNDLRLTCDIAEQVSSGSNQISSVSQTLSQGTTEQASAIEQLSVTIQSIAEISKRNSEEASRASQICVEAARGVGSSNDYMDQMLKAMEDITLTSKEISKIVKAIDDLAFQTNILSLNAAVEAARAGTSGKGFAVVADEVRNLAQRSAEAAKSTTALVDSTLVAIENGRNIADATAKSLLSVNESTQLINNTIGKITEASLNQALATEQVLQGIEQISSVVQINSATSEECAAAAQELATQAKTLSEMTNQYKFFDKEKLNTI